MVEAQPLDVFTFATGSLNHIFSPIAYGHENLPLIQWGKVIWEKY